MEEQKEIRDHFRRQQERLVYYIIALSVTAIGFSIYRTEGQKLSLSHIPVGIAVLSWGLSIFYGIKFTKYNISTLYANNEYFNILNGRGEFGSLAPNMKEAAIKGIKEAMKSNSERAGKYFRWQEKLFYMGVFMYLVWHVWIMINK